MYYYVGIIFSHVVKRERLCYTHYLLWGERIKGLKC